MIPYELYCRLRQLREQEHWTLSQIARELGLHRETRLTWLSVDTGASQRENARASLDDYGTFPGLSAKRVRVFPPQSPFLLSGWNCGSCAGAGASGTRGHVKQNFLRRLYAHVLGRGQLCRRLLPADGDSSAHPRQHARKIVALSEIYGVEEVDRALRDALEFEAFSSEYIANILEQRRRAARPRRPTSHPTSGSAGLGFTPNGPGSIRKPKQGDPMKTAVELDTFLKELQLVWIRQQYEALAARQRQLHLPISDNHTYP